MPSPLKSPGQTPWLSAGRRVMLTVGGGLAAAPRRSLVELIAATATARHTRAVNELRAVTGTGPPFERQVGRSTFGRACAIRTCPLRPSYADRGGHNAVCMKTAAESINATPPRERAQSFTTIPAVRRPRPYCWVRTSSNDAVALERRES